VSSQEGLAPFVLPGPAPDRETLQGWQHWRSTRNSFVPAPRLDLAAYQALSRRGQGLHDLHRAATHANLAFQETPMSIGVARMVGGRIQSNALKHKPTTRAGVMVNGAGYQGKTETVCEVAAAFEEQWLALHGHLVPDAVAGTRDLHAPVAYAQTPVTATPKSTCQAILGFYGAPHRGMTLPQLVAAVRTSLRDHGTKVLILDDITRLRMHREADQDVLGLLRSLMSMDVTLILVGVGIHRSGLLREGRTDQRSAQWVFPAGDGGFNDEAATQTERRFDLVNLDPFRYDTPEAIAAWVAHLAGIETQLRLFNATLGMLTDGTMPEYLYRRTGGIVGLLERLIEDGAALAIAEATETLTESLLDSIEINLGNVPGRDPAAGEIPTLPARADTATAGVPQPPVKKKRARATVFDDRGTPSTASAS